VFFWMVCWILAASRVDFIVLWKPLPLVVMQSIGSTGTFIAWHFDEV